MGLEKNTKHRSLEGIRGALDRVRTLMRNLGVDISVWDREGILIQENSARCEYCRTMQLFCGAGGDYAQNLAKRVMDKGCSEIERIPQGCFLIGVPIFKRRRLLGMAMGCFPVREMLDQERLARLCDRYQLDFQVVSQQLHRDVRHDAADAVNVLNTLQWALQREQEQLVAQAELDKLSMNLGTTYEELSLLYRISGSMRVTQDPESFIRNICEELLDVMDVQGVVSMIHAHPPSIEEDLILLAGDSGLDEKQARILMSLDLAGKLIGGTTGVVDNHFTTKREYRGKIKNLVAVPLVIEEELIGQVVALNKNDGEFDSIALKLITAIGGQMSSFLSNNRLYADLQDLLMGVLHALTATIDAKDPYTCGHSTRVAMISKRLAELVGIPAQHTQQIYLTGLLHDIGKIGIPESILCKEGRLTNEEYLDIQRHPAIGAKILGGIRQLDEMIPGIIQHHERPDGKGYPYGLKGEDLSIEGQIIGLADCFDAMTSDRTYRKALPLDVALEEIRSHAGTQFNPRLVEVFLKIDFDRFMKELYQPTKIVFPLKEEAKL